MDKFVLMVPLALLLAACNSSSEDAAPPPAPPGTALEAPSAPPLEADTAALLVAHQSSTARDPGPRSALAGAGDPLSGLSANELAAFTVGKEDFDEAEDVPAGLGPTMNLDSCGGCHSQPASGGTSPAVNPQVAFATKNGATNVLPSFLSLKGPVREARFVKNADGSADGGVHAIFTIAGRADATPDCTLAQPDFERAVATRNVIFRIPTPVFGAGLIEQIPDREILAGQARNANAKQAMGIKGHANLLLASQAVSGQTNKNGNDGTIGRFGWKAQNKSLMVFSGEAYNVEMGITNDLFQTERDETDACQFAATPNSVTDFGAASVVQGLASIEKFATFMRLLAPPTPSLTAPGGSASIASGRALFDSVGCALCHSPSLQTGNTTVAALRNQSVGLFSDLLVHDMGVGLADGVAQGQANGREFRTAPLWGLGQRLFFLHDGRTTDLQQAVLAHASARSEANGVIKNFLRLSAGEEQDLLNFLRSL